MSKVSYYVSLPDVHDNFSEYLLKEYDSKWPSEYDGEAWELAKETYRERPIALRRETSENLGMEKQ